MELELKYLAAYLPYDLSIKWTQPEEHKNSLFIMSDKDCIKQMSVVTMMAIIQGNKNYKPILKPLHEYKDIPEIMDEFSDYSEELFQNAFFILEGSLNRFDFINYSVAELMFKHHLDLFGLIPKDLAIDINTL